MNPILEAFPNEITVENTRYTINTDFRLWLQLFYYARKKEHKKQVEEILNCICPEIEISENPQAVINELVDFSMLAEHSSKHSESKAKSRLSVASKKLFDLFVDADVIYADFMRDYHIDLNVAQMHWLKFKVLLNGVTSKSATEQRKSFRATDLKDVAVKHREAVRISQDALWIEDDTNRMTLAERDKAMVDYVRARQKEAHKGGTKN